MDYETMWNKLKNKLVLQYDRSQRDGKDVITGTLQWTIEEMMRIEEFQGAKESIK